MNPYPLWQKNHISSGYHQLNISYKTFFLPLDASTTTLQCINPFYTFQLAVGKCQIFYIFKICKSQKGYGVPSKWDTLNIVWVVSLQFLCAHFVFESHRIQWRYFAGLSIKVWKVRKVWKQWKVHGWAKKRRPRTLNREREKNAESHGCSVCHHSVSIHETNTQSQKVLDHWQYG